MSDQTPFSQTPAEPTELERIQSRIQNYRIQISPPVAQAIQALLVSFLKSDQVTIDDLEVMVSIRNELKGGLEDYKNSVDSAQKRLLEIQQEEVQQKQIEIANRTQLEKTKLNEEKVRRKNLEDRVKKLEEEKNFLEKRVVRAQQQAAAQPISREEAMPKVEKKPTKAFEQAKAKRGGGRAPEPTKQKLPEPKVEVTEFKFEPEFDLDHAPPKQPEVKSEAEYEEITIPSRNDLERMTKNNILAEAKKLKFEVSTDDTKKEMINSFEKQTEELIKKLQSTGEFVSATVDGDDETDVRDGGTF